MKVFFSIISALALIGFGVLVIMGMNMWIRLNLTSYLIAVGSVLTPILVGSIAYCIYQKLF